MKRWFSLAIMLMMVFSSLAAVSAQATASPSGNPVSHGDEGDRDGDGNGYSGGSSGGSGGYGGGRGGGYGRGGANVSYASSYINPDAGAATANPDVNQNSNCYQPDQYDDQQLSASGTNSRNVHNDACLFDRRGNYVDAPVSWESTGVGVIFRCPDPDGAGPKTAVVTGNRCYQTGFQATGMAGDGEYHLRLDNGTSAGGQYVSFCYDPENNGCRDARAISYIQINWTF